MEIHEVINEEYLGKLKKLGIKTLSEFLLYLPSRYKDYRTPHVSFDSVELGDKLFLRLKLIKRPQINMSTRPNRVNLLFTDGKKDISAMSFGTANLWKSYKEGDYVHVIGKRDMYNGWPQIKGIELVPKQDVGRIIAVYRGKDRVIKSHEIAFGINAALRDYTELSVGHICERIGETEENILKVLPVDFSSISQILYNLHRPRSAANLNSATNAVRLLNAYLALKLMKVKARGDSNKSIINYDVDVIKSQLKNIPFELTNGQKRAIWEISKDLKLPSPMDRLISGDVGCGKTLSYSVPAVCSYLSGARVVIMMPNALLATQVYGEIKETFPDADTTLMISGSEKPSDLTERKSIIVGTTSILFWIDSLEEKYEIDLLILDEQQKLGTKQKEALISEHTNIIEATATAIPMTVASALYGGKKISLIEECPVDKTIHTKVCGVGEKTQVFSELNQIVRDGYQVAVLYPLKSYPSGSFAAFLPEFSLSKNKLSSHQIIDELIEKKASILEQRQEIHNGKQGTLVTFKASHAAYKKITKSLLKLEKYDVLNLGEINKEEEEAKCKRSVESAYLHWQKLYPDQVVMIHGGMNMKEKSLALQKAKSGDCKVIVTSSVIEIGLTMPNLRGLCVIEAENYGASTLHQFRGRIARNGGEGLFIMLTNKEIAELEPQSLERLNLLVNNQKGSLIAEENMRLQGFGDLTGKSELQSGLMDGLFKGLKMTPQDVDILIKKLKSNQF